MSEITKACGWCRGTGMDSCFVCVPCRGDGFVPDVEAQLRAEITALSLESEELRQAAEEWRDKYVKLVQEIERLGIRSQYEPVANAARDVLAKVSQRVEVNPRDL